MTQESRKRERQSLGPLISLLLQKKRMTQVSVASSIGMSPAQMSNFLKEKSDIHAATFVQILEALGIDLTRLLRAEAQGESFETRTFSRKLELLPCDEKDALVHFLDVYQARSCRDRSLIGDLNAE